MANDNEISQDGAAGVNRRNLLKGAVAAGVGVVAWSSPSITSIGMTPAYAQTCTGGYQVWVIDYRNTACNCFVNANEEKWVSYKDPYNESSCQTQAPPRTVAFYQANTPDPPTASAPAPLDNSGSCPPVNGSSTGAYAYIGAGGTLEFCRLRVESVQGNCSSLTIRGTAYSDIVGKDEAKYVAMPRVYCGSGSGFPSNVFLRISLECANDEACLPPATP